MASYDGGDDKALRQGLDSKSIELLNKHLSELFTTYKDAFGDDEDGDGDGAGARDGGSDDKIALNEFEEFILECNVTDKFYTVEQALKTYEQTVARHFETEMTYPMFQEAAEEMADTKFMSLVDFITNCNETRLEFNPGVAKRKKAASAKPGLCGRLMYVSKIMPDQTAKAEALLEGIDDRYDFNGKASGAILSCGTALLHVVEGPATVLKAEMRALASKENAAILERSRVLVFIGELDPTLHFKDTDQRAFQNEMPLESTIIDARCVAKSTTAH
jgi:hypothetical protein